MTETGGCGKHSFRVEKHGILHPKGSPPTPAVLISHIYAHKPCITRLLEPHGLFFSLLPQYCLCMTEGILLFSAEVSPFCCKSRKFKVRLHWFCQALVLVSGVTGLCFMIASKNLSEHPHLVTWHSLLGVGTLVATVVQAACGVCLMFPKLAGLSSSLSRLKLYHATCGLVVYLLATMTVVLSMFSDWFQATIKGAAWWALLLLPLFPALVVMNQITNSYLPRKKVTS